jgi:hypothetical protein
MAIQLQKQQKQNRGNSIHNKCIDLLIQNETSNTQEQKQQRLY